MSYIGNLETEFEPIILEKASTSERLRSIGNQQQISEPIILEQAPVGEKLRSIGNQINFSEDVDMSLEVFVPSSFIIAPSTIEKGSLNRYTLVKSVLLQEPIVQQSSYFSDESNINLVVVKFKSTEGNQSNFLYFYAKSENSYSYFDPSDRARNQWEIEYVLLFDFDRGSLRLDRSNVDLSQFDINFNS